jgi:hypothetical protein
VRQTTQSGNAGRIRRPAGIWHNHEGAAMMAASLTLHACTLAGGTCPLRRRIARSAGLLLALWLLLAALPGLSGTRAAPSAAEVSQQDTADRAAYLYNFLTYIEWPSRAFPLADSPVVIGVFNADEVAAELLLTTVGRSVENRPVLIKQLREGDAMDDIHLVYIGPGEAEKVEFLVKQVPQRWTVTVTDADAGSGLGAVINFRHADGRLRFEVSRAAAERGDFKLSSRLMPVAIMQPGQN